MATFNEVLSAARSLDPNDQLQLASVLWDQIGPETWPSPDAEWVAEAQRRSAEFDSGRNPASPWPEVQARARRKAGLDD